MPPKPQEMPTRGVAHLARAGFAAQLRHRLHQRHEAADGAAGLAAGELAAVGGHREVAVEVQVVLLDEAAALALLAEAVVLDGHHRDEGVVVVGLEELDVAVRDAGHLHGLGRRLHEAGVVTSGREREPW